MQKRILAILALILFICGLAVFICSLAAGTNDYTFYAVVLCAPGAVLALLNTMGQRRAQELKTQEEDENETAE